MAFACLAAAILAIPLVGADSASAERLDIELHTPANGAVVNVATGKEAAIDFIFDCHTYVNSRGSTIGPSAYYVVFSKTNQTDPFRNEDLDRARMPKFVNESTGQCMARSIASQGNGIPPGIYYWQVVTSDCDYWVCVRPGPVHRLEVRAPAIKPKPMKLTNSRARNLVNAQLRKKYPGYEEMFVKCKAVRAGRANCRIALDDGWIHVYMGKVVLRSVVAGKRARFVYRAKLKRRSATCNYRKSCQRKVKWTAKRNQ